MLFFTIVRRKDSISVKIVVVSRIIGNGIYIVDFLPDGESYNSEYFVEHILNRLVKMKADIWGGSDVKKNLDTS